MQTGNGLMIYATTNTNSYVAVLPQHHQPDLHPVHDGRRHQPGGRPEVTNAAVFQAQDYQGNVLTNNQNNRVIRCSLAVLFDAAPKPGGGCYQLQTSVAPRAQN